MTHGGRREGAGRPALQPNERRQVPLQVNLTREQADWLKKEAKLRKLSISALVAAILTKFGMPS